MKNKGFLRFLGANEGQSDQKPLIKGQPIKIRSLLATMHINARKSLAFTQKEEIYRQSKMQVKNKKYIAQYPRYLKPVPLATLLEVLLEVLLDILPVLGGLWGRDKEEQEAGEEAVVGQSEGEPYNLRVKHE